jgi:hypothetical protein
MFKCDVCVRQIDAARVQLVRIATRQRRGDDARHVRQHSAREQARRRAWRAHHSHAQRRADGHLRRSR